MARLPQPGGDSGNWGEILNDYLSQSHKTDGQLKDSVVTANVLAPSSVTTSSIAETAITRSKLSLSVQSELDRYLSQTEVDARVKTVGDGIYTQLNSTGAITPEMFGAKGNLRAIQSAASIAKGSNKLICTSAEFTNSDVGKIVVVDRAGVGGMLTALTATAVSTGATTLLLNTYVPRGRYRLGDEPVFVQSTTGTGPYTATTYALPAAASGTALKSVGKLVSTITSVSDGVATLSSSAAFTVANVTIWYGNDDTEALQECLDHPSSRVRILSGKYLSATGVSVSKPQNIIGGGGSLTGSGASSHDIPSGIFALNADSVALNILVSGVTVNDIGLVYIGAEAQTSGGGFKTIKAHNTVIHGVTAAGFRDNYIWSGCYWKMTGCSSYDWTRYGILVRNAVDDIDTWDHGDFGIVNCTLTGWNSVGDMDSAVRWECGGGLRMHSVKINARGQTGNSAGAVLRRGIDIAVADGTYLTDIIIDGISIANTYDASIWVGQQTVGAGSGISCVSVTNCQINANYSHQGSVGRGIVLHGSDSAHWNSVRASLIANNNFSNNFGENVYLDNVNGVYIGPNIHHNCALGGVNTPLINIDGTGTGTSTARNVSVEPQVVSWNENTAPSSIDRIRDTRRASISTRGITRHEYEKSVQLASNISKNLWHFDLWTNYERGNAGSFVLELAGNLASADPVFLRHERIFTVVKDTNTVQLTTLGTDVTAGAATLTVTYTTTTNGRILISVAVPSGAYTSAEISAKLHINSPGIKLLREYAPGT